MDHDLQLDSNLMNDFTNDNHGSGELCVEEMLPCRGNITPQIIERLEADLEFYEKVSLVFLLYDNVDIGIQRLKSAELAYQSGRQQSHGLLADWARHINYPDWEDKFLEALCVVQNYSVVEKLGFNKNDVETRFLPQSPDVALFVDLMRKALYLLCERLTKDQEKTLIDLVKTDMLGELTPVNFNHETQFLEIHLLYWISHQYIMIQNRSCDLKNLTKHFKVMGESQLVDYLESIARVYADPDRPTNTSISSMEVPVSVSSFSHRENKDVETHSVLSDFIGGGLASGLSEEVYHIDPESVGYCVIINQKNFYRESDLKWEKYLSPETLEDRTGTDVDKDSLSEAFQHFGFTVKVWEDCDHVKILESIECAANELVQENHSSFVLCILSHGIENKVYGVNSIPVSLDDIEERIQGKYCPKLIDKPKILIIQACQGRDTQDCVRFRIPSDSDVSVDGPGRPNAPQLGTCPAISDSFVMWSTIRGFASFRHKVKGSWFIQTLCELLLASTDGVDMEAISRAVNRKIKTQTANIGSSKLQTMQPMYTSTLSKKLFLPCKKAVC